MSKLGTCCICEKKKGVRNILTLHSLCPTPGKGWGCLVCGLPNNGAVAVLCDHCHDELIARNAQLKWICTGYPAEDGRSPYSAGAELMDSFNHDYSKHPEHVVNN